eukprot:scaffold4470_cov255-Prasinococcus_capsulatus_cf.AAC.31
MTNVPSMLRKRRGRTYYPLSDRAGVPSSREEYKCGGRGPPPCLLSARGAASSAAGAPDPGGGSVNAAPAGARTRGAYKERCARRRWRTVQSVRGDSPSLPAQDRLGVSYGHHEARRPLVHSPGLDWHRSDGQGHVRGCVRRALSSGGLAPLSAVAVVMAGAGTFWLPATR